MAKEFAGDDSRGFSEHVKGFDVFHVNGGQNAADRKALLDGFKTAPKSLITNARCLTEGVDVPAVDMVAFVDPRKSKIDIAQAAGRAMRQSKATNKKLGYIVVPLFIEQKKGETEEAALKRSGFDEVAEVLRAMLETDDDLLDNIREMQEARGRGDKFNPKRLHDKIEVIGPSIDLDKLRHSIDVEILDRLGIGWDKWFGLLQKFHNDQGHCLVTQKFVTDGLNLGIWVGNQRAFKNRLTPDQIKRLDSLGFSWDPLSEQWEKHFSALQKFKEREGHCRVVRGKERNELVLARWVMKLRQNKNQLSSDQIKRLDSLGFSWTVRSDQWEEAFERLQRFKKYEGHCRVNVRFVLDGFKLGRWVNMQRTRKNRLTSEQIKRLDSLGFSWDPQSEQWEKIFEVLQKFKEKEGHCLVGRPVVFDGIKLGQWVNIQRTRKHGLSLLQIRRLNSIGFSWDARSDQWEEAFVALKKFHKREGHFRVDKTLVAGGMKLASWAIRQRQLKNNGLLTSIQVKRLDSIGFSWDPVSEQWEKAFVALKKFYKREGHCRVPATQIEDGLKIGLWVGVQRLGKSKGSITPDRIMRLDSMGFSWDPRTDRWEEGFSALQKFKKREGHCQVAQGIQVDGIKLGSWVNHQRMAKNKGQLTSDRIRRLDSLGFVWKV